MYLNQNLPSDQRNAFSLQLERMLDLYGGLPSKRAAFIRLISDLAEVLAAECEADGWNDGWASAIQAWRESNPRE